MSRALLVAMLGAALGCGGPAATERRPPLTPATAPLELDGLRGDWRWRLAREANGVRTVEAERWLFVDDRGAAAPAEGSPALVGRYVREVEVSSLDGRPFACNQAPRYVQRAAFDVVAEIHDGAVVVREVEARAEPSPCEHGLRQLGRYAVELGAASARLRWDGGVQTLLRVGPGPRALPPLAWAGDAPRLAGAWAWAATTDADAAHVRDEREAWTLGTDAANRVDGTVDRTIVVRTRDGQPSPCGGPARWTVRERVRVDGYRLDDRYLVREVEVLARAVEPSSGCAGAERVLDAAFVELVGDALVLEWRGKRRQVLERGPRP